MTKRLSLKVVYIVKEKKKNIFSLTMAKGMGMKDLQIAERTHEANIMRLVKEFGSRKEKMIREVYNSKRQIIEGSTSINDFSAIITYRKVREKLME